MLVHCLYQLVSVKAQRKAEEGWKECCHSRLSRGNRRPGITAKEIVGNSHCGKIQSGDLMITRRRE